MINFKQRDEATLQPADTNDVILFLDTDGYLKTKNDNGDLESLTLGGGSATEDALINGLTVGKGAGDIATNTVLGYQALNTNTTGFENVASGYNTLLNNTTGSQCVAIGHEALMSNTTGGANVAIGRVALYSNTTGINNTAINSRALYSNTTGSGNTSVGQFSMRFNTTANSNAAFGANSLYSNTTGASNTALGTQALYSNTTSSLNTAIGTNSLFSNTTGDNNTAIGNNSGRYITGGGANQTSSNSLYLGYDTRASANGNTNEIVIGYLAEGLGSNTVVLGNASITNTYLRGATGINTTSVNASAQLQIDSTTKGFLPPRMTAAQASAIGSPAEGLLLYVTDTDGTFTSKGWWGYDGAAWAKLNN